MAVDSPSSQSDSPSPSRSSSPGPLAKLGHNLKPSVIAARIKSSANGHDDDEKGDAGVTSGKAVARHAAKREDKAARAERHEAERQELKQRLEREDKEAAETESPEMREKYGDLDHPAALLDLGEVSELKAGKHVAFRARIHTQRHLSSKLEFILFRAGTHSIQGVVTREEASEHMIRWTRRLSPESIVHVTGELREPKEPIKSATMHDLEVHVETIHLVSDADVPFSIYNPPTALHTRLSNRIVDLRDPANQAIFRIRSKVLKAWRDGLDDLGFLEINTPKLQPSATESGAEVFKVNYFGRQAFLAQSPQLAKQMAISADLRKVYEIGPVFRAENSNTHRHLTEYTGLDLEMVLQTTYEEVISVLIKVLLKIFEAIYADADQINLVKTRWDVPNLLWPSDPDDVPVIPFAEGVDMLRRDGREVEMEDLSTRDEIRLGELVKDKYQADFFVLDKFPKSARPFYTMPFDDTTTRSFDMFVRGQEICTGGQRIHDPKQLRDAMREAGIAEQGMDEYLGAFDYGVSPHGGAGLGLERIITFALGLENVRNASLFHRDPKSLPARPLVLPHPESSTLNPATKEAPPLENLIANYGDASNTSWLDDRFEIWRHSNGAAVGYVPQGKFVFITGDPLCDDSQKASVASSFIDFAKRKLNLTPVWMLVSDEMEDILGRTFGWRTLSCTEEQRLDADQPHGEQDSRDQRRAEREGIRCEEVRPSDDLIRKVDARIEEWKKERGEKGKQVHLTEIAPWKDDSHRRYFVAYRGSGVDEVIDAMVVLARLSPKHGYQVKWALDFPNSGSSSIEALVAVALSAIPNQPVTFGAGVSDKLVPGNKLRGARARFLSHTYKGIVRSLSLREKKTFRDKFGVQGEGVWICYPQGRVGVADLKAIVGFFED